MNKRKTGTYYEEAVCHYLMENGLEIVEKNFRCRFGEIDIIAKEKEYFVFIEVKYRKDERYGTALEAVNRKKQRTICKCADCYCMLHKEATIRRYDVVGIQNEEIIWVKDAFPHIGF